MCLHWKSRKLCFRTITIYGYLDLLFVFCRNSFSLLFYEWKKIKSDAARLVVNWRCGWKLWSCFRICLVWRHVWVIVGIVILKDFVSIFTLWILFYYQYYCHTDLCRKFSEGWSTYLMTVTCNSNNKQMSTRQDFNHQKSVAHFCAAIYLGLYHILCTCMNTLTEEFVGLEIVFID